ncbi:MULTISPECIES: hypothetical protein [Novosphingobium]|uniref:Lipoprotein n=1 Tax=Novosphingobium pentaromativorans US6-1 TaxID=1088721 RepID=G6EA11_9SPHN|nr:MULTISPECIES: hypothetical protein [Novosphingobium]AIT80844.1 hypothetical protein JI59_14190 [Novosphingobium pentaromativorans US6-1]EHJ61868.1 hypothetical protein NSU_1182 [Novosphingobium pentaromativorans US6-1]GFM28498.1 putative lipoprotein [Novosphingobium sp. PY1]
MKKISGLLLVGCSALALAGCGADDISSPGAGGITINNPTPAPTPTPTSGSGTVVAADSCPTFNATGGLTDSGTISGPEGSWRVCTLPALVDVSSSLPKVAGVVYRLNGRVDVGCDGGFSAPTSGSPFTTTTASCNGRSLTADTDVTLTIDPGVIIYGENGSEAAWLAVNRGNKINAVGTASQPIIFTSRQNVVGTNDDSSQGQWGGVVLLGRGIVTDCNYGSTAAKTCERDTEGAVNKAVFGGQDNAYNAGTMKYVQIRYSGYVLSNGKELQSLTAEGVGSGTTLDYFQSVNSSDDGAEFFGGKVQFKHYISVNADDDSLDLDTGLEGYFQYVMLLQRDGGGDALMEIDSNGAETDTPRQKTVIANFTGVQPSSSSNNESNDQASVLIRGNSDITWVNGIINTPNNECLRLNGSGTTPATLKAYSTVMSCGSTKYIDSGTNASGYSASQFASGTNLNDDAFTSTLSSTFVNGTNEAGVAGYADIKTLSSFFDAVTYIGAVKDSSDTWYKGWTCDNATANFGSGESCTALPTT